MTFDPKKHMTNLKGKDYLEVKWRIVWFRDVCPDGGIQTELVNVDPIVVKASIVSASGAIIATGFGTAATGGSAVWKGREIEKAETAAIGRALAHAGYGTQFTGEDERDNLADSPVERRPKPQAPARAQTHANAPTGTNTPTASTALVSAQPDGAASASNMRDEEILSPDSVYMKTDGKKWIAVFLIPTKIDELAREVEWDDAAALKAAFPESADWVVQAKAFANQTADTSIVGLTAGAYRLVVNGTRVISGSKVSQ